MCFAGFCFHMLIAAHGKTVNKSTQPKIEASKNRREKPNESASASHSSPRMANPCSAISIDIVCVPAWRVPKHFYFSFFHFFLLLSSCCRCFHIIAACIHCVSTAWSLGVASCGKFACFSLLFTVSP